MLSVAFKDEEDVEDIWIKINREIYTFRYISP